MLDLFLELMLRWNIRHVDAFPPRRVFPSVIGAANPIVLDVAEIERTKPMRAVRPDHAHCSIPGTKGHQVFAQQFDAQWLPAGLLDVRHRHDWNPVLPE